MPSIEGVDRCPMAQTRTFGEVLKTYRQERGLTQEDLAEAASLSTRGISDLERGASRSPREETLWRLATALRLSDRECAELRSSLECRRAVSRGWHRHSPWATSPPAGLPIPPTPIVGRAQEVEEVVGLLGRTEVRLVTLTGPGGAGKTRLALEVASVLTPLFADGVHLVELDSVRDPATVSAILAGSLGVLDAGDRLPLENLKAYLQDRVLLLVLDNCAQILEAAPLIADYWLRRAVLRSWRQAV